MQLIDKQINKYATTIADEQFIFQQDYAVVDINIIENCWIQLTRAVHAKVSNR